MCLCSLHRKVSVQGSRSRLGRFVILIRTLEQGGCSLSPDHPVSVLSSFFSICLPFIPLWNYLPLCFNLPMYDLQNFPCLPSPPFFNSFPLSIWGVCLSCRDAGSVSESIMIVIVPGGSPWELPRTRVSLGWVTACQLPPPNQTAWGTEISRPRQQICTDMDCMSQLLTPPVGLLLAHWCRGWNSLPLFISFMHKHMLGMLFCWCTSLLAK